MIGILDYGSGNLRAFTNIYKKLGIPAAIIQSSIELKSASKLILPGVGSFDYAMQRLKESEMWKVIDEIVMRYGVPIMGVCVGMQMLAHSSEEGSRAGLGWIDAEVLKFDSKSYKHPMNVPHIGWNDVKPLKANHLLDGLERGARFYFLHSYYLACHKKEEIVAVTEYGTEFACVVNKKNIYGVQFHPEKSHQWGIQVLKNFASL
jgi:imidazole glycerol-phosphate synthase subunit HisH